MSRFLIFTGIILMTISFFIPSIFTSEAGKSFLYDNDFLTAFSVFFFVILVFFLQKNYYSKHRDLVDRANSRIPNLF